MSPASIPPLAAASAAPFASGPAASLLHPVPLGMRDLLPAEAEAQGALAAGVLGSFELFGYQRVSLPVFEYADVLERGLGEVQATSLLRFVEPETGAVVALRPDVTPQVARLVATRLASWPLPLRLSYRGSVLRRQHERARHDQQFLQAGIELIGESAVEGDLEVLRAMAAALRASGLDRFVLDLGHGGVASSLLAGAPPEARAGLLEALSQKDELELERRGKLAALEPKLRAALVSLLGLHGQLDVFEEARVALAGTPALAHVAALEVLARSAMTEQLAPEFVIDLGETRTVPYYTGAMFQVLAEGPGQAVASGGRYDGLLESFGVSLPAAGAAIHVDHLRWALGTRAGSSRRRVLVVAGDEARTAVVAGDIGDAAQAVVRKALGALRSSGVASASFAGDGVLGYARAWRFDRVLFVETDGEGRPTGQFSLCRVTETGLEPAAGSAPVVGLEEALRHLAD